MAVYSRGQRRTVLVLLALTSITLITLDLRGEGGGAIGSVRGAARDAFAPVEGAADAVFSPVGDFVDALTEVGSLKDENRRLRRRLERAEGELARVQGLDAENQVLRDLHGLDFVEGIDSVSAKVVALAPGNFEASVTIDRGRRHGVRKDMPVVSGAGLVGRVVEVYGGRSKALVLTDPRMAVGVRLAKSRETGVTRGLAGKTVLDVDLIAPEVEVAENELVVTSGLEDARYPPGIPVGTVASVSTRPGALEKDVRIEPLADLERLEFVKVLLWQPPQRPRTGTTTEEGATR